MVKKNKEEAETLDAEVSVEKKEPKKEAEVAKKPAPAPLGKINKPKSVEEALNMAADLAARMPAHAGKGAKQHGTDIGAAIRDLLK